MYDSSPAEIAAAFGIQDWKDGDLHRLQTELTKGVILVVWQQRLRTCESSLNAYLDAHDEYRKHLGIFQDHRKALQEIERREFQLRQRYDKLEPAAWESAIMLGQIVETYANGPVKTVVQPATKDLSKKLALVDQIANELPGLSPESLRLTHNAKNLANFTNKMVAAATIIPEFGLGWGGIRNLQMTKEMWDIDGEMDPDVLEWKRNSLERERKIVRSEYELLKEEYDRWLLQCEDVDRDWQQRSRKKLP